MQMKKILWTVLTIGFALGASGCAHEIKGTPIVMTFDASKVDFSKIDSMKHGVVCHELDDKDGDLSLIAAAKAADISKIMYVETSYQQNKGHGKASCLTVYGE